MNTNNNNRTPRRYPDASADNGQSRMPQQTASNQNNTAMPQRRGTAQPSQYPTRLQSTGVTQPAAMQQRSAQQGANVPSQVQYRTQTGAGVPQQQTMHYAPYAPCAPCATQGRTAAPNTAHTAQTAPQYTANASHTPSVPQTAQAVRSSQTLHTTRQPLQTAQTQRTAQSAHNQTQPASSYQRPQSSNSVSRTQQAQPQTQAQRTSQVQPQAQTQRTSQAQPQAQTQRTSQAQPQAQTQRTSQAQPQTQTQRTSQAQPQTQTQRTSQAQPQAQTQRTSQVQPQAQTQRTSQAQNYSRPQAQSPAASHTQVHQSAHTTRTYSRPRKVTDTPAHTQLTASQRKKPAKGQSADRAVYREKDNTFASVIKAMMYIVFVIVISGFLSYYIIAIGNDIFAFVKSDDIVVIQLDDHATTADVANTLYEKGVIGFPKIFELYVNFRSSLRTSVEDGYMSGVFEVTPSLAYDDLVYSLIPKGVSREEVSITIREGLTINEIIDVFLAKGIGTREGFIDVIQNHDFDYWFIDEMGELNPNRTYRLEGYLYPDTYYFYTDSSEAAIIKKFLDRFDEMFDERYKESCEAVGMTVDEVIILASMIQMEGKYVSEYGAISSVFHNRLNNPRAETAGFLNSDATIQYALNERKSVLTSEDTELDSPYNTYQHKGLPPGPICCPSLDAMNYAMYPDDTKYFYFVSRTNGYSLFAETAEEHTQNIIDARAGQ